MLYPPSAPGWIPGPPPVERRSNRRFILTGIALAVVVMLIGPAIGSSIADPTPGLAGTSDVAVCASTGEEPAADPVVLLAGGPGGSALYDWSDYADLRFLERGDLIVVDQRGTGRSHHATRVGRRSSRRTGPRTGASLPDAGHGVLGDVDCAGCAVLAFLDGPTDEVALDCLTAKDRLEFER